VVFTKTLQEKFMLTSPPSEVLIPSLSICRVVHNRGGFFGEAQMDKKEELVNAVLKSVNSGQQSDDQKRLTCAEAFELAKKIRDGNY